MWVKLLNSNGPVAIKPLNTADLGTGQKGPKSGGIPKTAVYIGSHIIYNLQNPYLGLGIGRRYWPEGGGIGRGGIEGDDCIPH